MEYFYLFFGGEVFGYCFEFVRLSEKFRVKEDCGVSSLSCGVYFFGILFRNFFFRVICFGSL